MKKRLKNPSIKKKIQRSSKLDLYKETIDTKVDKYKSKAINVYKFIKKLGYTCGYGIVKNYIKSQKESEIKNNVKI